ncbi:type III PLP-dependent enzyme [Hahella ganghwensis]|uniref:type III PLP-dependent enzyme n=1 Tax=Hahella ganghwensis TaxID=286420 RepID=UPI00037DDD01|nr:type III PLP-dependent enzyme [Hahella ganghwensis]
MTETIPSQLPDHIVANAKTLALKAQDPVSAFIYDLDSLRHHTRQLMSQLPKGVELYYAIKANSEPEVLEALAPIVDGFEISSGGEIQKVVDCSLRKSFIFSGPGKLDSDLREAISHRVEMIHLESLTEIHRLDAIAAEMNRRQKVLLRINPVLPDSLATKLSMAGVPTPFGIDENQLIEAIALVEKSEHLILSGFHIHAMSHQTEVSRHKQLLDWYLEKWTKWKGLVSDKSNLHYFNVGGGIGVNYLSEDQFDWGDLCQHLKQKIKQHSNPPRIRFEAGRFISAFCGYYLVQVLDIKQTHGQIFAVCRGGTHQFRLPAAQSHDHPVIHLPMDSEGQQSTSMLDITVVGQLCTPKDILSRHRKLKDLRVGDLLVLPKAGAYGYNISHTDFLCHPKPLQIFLDSSVLDAYIQRSEKHVATACK